MPNATTAQVSPKKFDYDSDSDTEILYSDDEEDEVIDLTIEDSGDYGEQQSDSKNIMIIIINHNNVEKSAKEEYVFQV